MASSIVELLGEALIEHNAPSDNTEQSQDKTKTIATSSLEKKTVGIYFSAHWCGPCRRFTPELTKLYKSSQEKYGNEFEIVFVSWDQDQESFDEYFQEMPWKALPFSNRDRAKQLGKTYEVGGIPSLIILSPTGEKITADGVEEVRAVSEKAFDNWMQGKGLFWSKENPTNEYSWEDIACDQCYLRPIIGNRYLQRKEENDEELNLCQECASKSNQADIFLIPKKPYSIEEIFQSVPYLVKPGSNEHIPTEDLWKNNVKTIGIYFSAHWCPPCQQFTPKLAELYNKASLDFSSDFRLIFVSCDRDEDSFREYHATMPWPAVPLRHGSIIKNYFDFSGIPSLFVLLPDGKILCRRGRDDISRAGLEAIQLWSKGEKLPIPAPEEFEWSSVYCDGCGVNPLVGLRYYCSTCGNYDLCSACQSKGHEHPLTIVPTPTDDDD